MRKCLNRFSAVSPPHMARFTSSMDNIQQYSNSGAGMIVAPRTEDFLVIVVTYSQQTYRMYVLHSLNLCVCLEMLERQ